MSHTSSSAPTRAEGLARHTCEVQPSSFKLPPALCEDASELLREDHMPVSQRFLQLVMSEPSGGFASSSSGIARQLWDLLIAYANKHKYKRRMDCTVWIDAVHPPPRPDTNEFPGALQQKS